jgi:hypothetical protein
MSKIIKAVLLAAVFATGAGAAQAKTITFNTFPANDYSFLSSGDAFSTDGYDFKVNSGFVYFVNSTFPGDATNGTTSLDLGGIVDITSHAHKPFSVTSIDLATLLSSETSTVKFTGTGVNGVQTTQSFTNNGTASADPHGLTTVSLAGFDNLTAFEMELVYDATGEAYLSLVDNIVIDDAAATVPEPSTCAMLGLGLAMLTGALRRKSR